MSGGMRHRAHVGLPILGVANRACRRNHHMLGRMGQIECLAADVCVREGVRVGRPARRVFERHRQMGDRDRWCRRIAARTAPLCLVRRKAGR